MMALSILMSEGNLRGNLESLLESAISNYLEVGMPIFATKATMLLYELLKQKNQYREAPVLLLKMIGEVRLAGTCLC
jgi:hypothetical protein